MDCTEFERLVEERHTNKDLSDSIYRAFIAHAEECHPCRLLSFRDDLRYAAAEHEEWEPGEAVVEAAPIMRIASTIILYALRVGASEIQFDLGGDEAVVSYRIDGVLRDEMTLPGHVIPAMVARYRVMAGLGWMTVSNKTEEGIIPVRLENRDYQLSLIHKPTDESESMLITINP